MAGKKKGNARLASGSKTQRHFGQCSECGEEVEVQRAAVYSPKRRMVWWCKNNRHEVSGKVTVK